MDYKEIIDKLVRELSFRVGVPNIHNKEHQSIMSEILSEWGEYEVKDTIFEFLTEKDETYTAKSKDSGVVVAFDSEEARDNAIEAGTHEKVDKKDDEETKEKSSTKLTAKDYADRPDQQKKKKKNKEDDVPNKNSKFPSFLEKSDDENIDYLIGTKDNPGKFTPVNDEDYLNVQEDSRKDASTGENAGKGGASTTAQEEAAGIAAEIFIKNPNLTPEQIQEELEKRLIEWPIYKGDVKEVKRIANVSMGQVEIVKEIINSDNYGEQSDGYPKPITFTGKITNATANFLVGKLNEAKESGDKDAIKHYQEELEAFAEFATTATGKEGDADTAFMYKDKNGRDRIHYITNKMSLADMKANTTKNVRAQNFVKNQVKGSDIEGLKTINEITSGTVKKMNEVAVERLSFLRDDVTLNESVKNFPPNILNALYGRATHDVNPKYRENLKKNPLVIDYLKNKNIDIDNATDSDLLDASLNVIGEKGADGIGDNKKGGVGKAFLKLGNLWKDLDAKVDQMKRKGYTDDKIYEEIYKIQPKKGKPLYGGVLNPQELKQLHENKLAKKLSEVGESRGDSMREAHSNIVTENLKLDIKYYQDKGLSLEEAEEKVNSLTEPNGPNTETYARTFMDEMHWTRIISGNADDRVSMSVGKYNVKPEHYRECFKDLTGYDGDISTPEGRQGLIDHLAKFTKIKPGEASVDFVNAQSGKSVQLGQDTWRTAGDGEKVEGKDGKDLQKCLESKQQ